MKSIWRLSCLLVVAASTCLPAFTQAPGQAHENLPVAKPDPNQPGPVVAPPDDQEGKTDEGFARKRMEWFVQQRAYPNEHIPAGARWNALQQHEVLKATAAARLAGGAHPQDAFTTPVWTSIGPQPLNSTPPFSGRAASIAIDPNTPSTIYLGTAGGGVWKTTDSGTTWKPLTDSQASLAIGALAVDPSNSNVIYAGTGEADYSVDSYYGQGILKSTDGGNTWTLTRAPFTTGTTAPDFTQIAIQPGNSSVVVASTLSGIYRTADAGATWTRVLSLTTTSVIFDKTNTSVMYAGINGYYSGASSAAAVYKSTNAGLTWTAMPGTGSNLLPASSLVLRTTLAQDSTGANLYASMANSSYNGPGTIYKSTDGGGNWTKLGNPTETGASDWYRDGLAVVPNTNPNVLFVGGVSIWQSVDGGITWVSDSHGGYYSDQHAFVPSPDGSKLYVADDGGISVTATPATSNPVFTSLNNGISTSTFYPGFSIIAGQPNSALAGTQDHGLDLYNNSLTWAYGDNDRYCGDGGGAYVDPQNSHAYAHCQGGSANWVANASGANSVTTYTSAQAGINTADRWPWVADIKGDPENVAIVYTATNKLYQSTNYAGLWTAISPDLTAGGTINTIAVSPTNSNVVYTGSGDGVIEVTNNALAGAAATWTKLTGLPNRGFTKIIVAPDSPQDVYAAVGGFGSGHLYNSTNGGTTWTDLSGNLPNTPVNGFLLDPALINTIYVATDTGVYYTTNKGSTWAILGTGLPNVVVQDILMYPTTRQIRVITHGRGAWDVTIAASGFTASVTALSFAAQPVGSSSAAQTVTLSNNLATAVPIGTIATTGNFSQTNTCGASLASGATCTVSVVFSPLSIGALTGTLTVPSTSGNLAVNLSGTGVAPSVALSVATVAFSNQLVNTTAPAQTVVLTNAGSASLTISSIGIAGANASDFAQTNTCGTAVAALATCNIAVTFTPSAGGSRVASLSISDNVTGSPQTVALVGTGTIPVVTATPSSLTFPAVPAGFQTAAQTVTLTNSGTAAATISGIAIGGANASQFTQTNNCGTTLNIGSSCTVTAVFAPNAVGSASATISATDNAANSPQTVSLTGTATAPFALSTSSSTATVTAGASATYTVQFTAATNYPASSAIQLACTGAPSRATCTVAPTSIAAGSSTQSITVTVATTATTTTGRLQTEPLHREESVVAFAALFGVFCFGFKLRSGRTRRTLFLLLVAASGTMLLLSGCTPGKSGPTTVPGTPTGSYPLVVTAQGTAYQATQNLTLTVQ